VKPRHRQHPKLLLLLTKPAHHPAALRLMMPLLPKALHRLLPLKMHRPLLLTLHRPHQQSLLLLKVLPLKLLSNQYRFSCCWQ
jgi:hypothetical protein